ncbi:MAG: type IX secretion system membrane protein PorP/SprF [Pedobacter sp.]|nr:MAG: type IX secretion system membrane protein PorP/SprF [Pedobacter sp.]
MKIKNIIWGLGLCAVGLFGTEAKAQIAPFNAMYFHNQYLNNPAFAGINQGLELNVGYRQQWSEMPGSPKVQTLTGSYALGSHTGLGINLNHDQTGLFKRTRFMGTYAYHLPLNSKSDKLSFGISVGVLDELVDFSLLDGDLGDNSAIDFNQRDQYIDGDFGIAYTSEKWKIQASVPHIKENLKVVKEGENYADAAQFYFSSSFKLASGIESGIGIEPQVGLRTFRGFDNIIDLGVNITLAQDKMGFIAMYHTNKAASLGFSGKLNNTFQLMGYYNWTTSNLLGQGNGTFELALKVKFLKKS